MVDLVKGEVCFNYEKVKNIYKNKGKDYFFSLFNRIFKKEFYSMSEHWLDNRMFILKLNGKYGDIIVFWE